MATDAELYRVDVVLWTPPASPCVPVLARCVELAIRLALTSPDDAQESPGTYSFRRVP